MRRVLLERLNNRVVLLHIDHSHTLVTEGHKLPDGRRIERLESPRDGDLAISDIFKENLCADLILIKVLTQIELDNLVEQLDDILVGGVAKRAQKRGRQKFAAALATIKINIEQITRVKLHFNP